MGNKANNGIMDSNICYEISLEKRIFDKCKCIIEEHSLNVEATKEIIARAVVESKEFSRTMWAFCNDIGMNCPNVFSKIDPEIFLHIVRHLKRIVNQKIESRNVGISLIIFTEPSRSATYGDFLMQSNTYEQGSNISDIKGFFNDDQNALQRTYKCIDSTKAFFAYSYNKEKGQLKFDGIKKFENHTFETICGEDTIGFNVSNGIPYIRIYNSDSRIIDYFMSEVSGDWVARFETNIINALKKQLRNVNENDIRIITKVAMQLSYLRTGAMLIITNDQNRFSQYTPPCKVNKEELKNVENTGVIYNYAAYDGAVIICGNKNNRLKVHNFGVILNPKGDNIGNGGYDLLLSHTNSGSRHEKAVRYACENPDDCLIVISENRTISILHGKTPIYWRDNPAPKNLIEQFKGGAKK